MASALLVWGSLAVLLVVLGSILGAVDGPERVVFVVGIGLFVLAHVAAPAAEALGAAVAAIGLLAALAATVPLLRQSV